jgi:hypothetical protein
MRATASQRNVDAENAQNDAYERCGNEVLEEGLHFSSASDHFLKVRREAAVTAWICCFVILPL